MSKISSLKQYKNKYRHSNGELLSFTKKELEEKAKLEGSDVEYFLKGRKWVKFNDTYYEIPKLFTKQWFRGLSAAAKLSTAVISIGAVSCAVGLPVYFNVFYYVEVSENIDDLLPSSEEERSYIKENVNISNTVVKLGKDFSTTVTIKDDRKGDFKIDNSTEIYVVKNSEKTKLVKGVDYTFKNNGSTADIVVFGKAVTGKIELDIKIKEVSFNRIINFESKTIDYDPDREPYSFEFELKTGRTLPEDTTITYTYNSASQSEPFTFSDVGVYEVNLKLEKEGYETFNKTETLTISSIEMPEDLKNRITFINTSRSELETTVPSIDNQSGVEFKETPTILYKVNDQWIEDSTALTEGEYEMKADLTFTNYNPYTLTGTFTVTDEGKIVMTFDAGDGEFIDGEKTKTTAKKLVVPEQTTFGEFKNTIEEYSDPNKEGHSFTGWFISSTGGTAITDETYVSSLALTNNTVYAQYSINTYNITDATEEKGGFKTLTIPAQAVYGSEVQVTAEANPGYLLDKIVVDDSYNYNFSEGIATIPSMPAKDISIKALTNFIDYSISDINKSEGVANAEASKTTACHVGDSITVTASAYTGYHLTGIKIKPAEGSIGELIPFSGDTATFTMPASNVEIYVYAEHNTEAFYFDKDGSSIKDGSSTEIDSIKMNIGDNIKAKLEELKSAGNLTVTHPYVAFADGWMLNGVPLSGDETATEEFGTLKPIFHKYTIIIETTEGGTLPSVTQYNDAVEVYTDVTPQSGYVIDHYEYKFGNDGTYTNANKGMPFRPYDYNKSIFDKTVYIKTVCKAVTETVEIFLDADGGTFTSTGEDFLAVTIEKGKTWNDIKDNLEKPTKDSQEATGWLTDSGAAINPTDPINTNKTFKAKYGGTL